MQALSVRFMDLNYLLIWIVCMSCLSGMIFADRTYARGWIFVSGFVLVVTVVSSYLAPAVGGLIGGCLWGILIMVPSIGFMKVNQLVAKQRFGQASKLATFLSWLHPADGWREQPKLLRALEMGQRGAMAEAITILNRYKTAKTPIGRNITATLYQMDSRWEELLVWIQENLPEPLLQKDSNMLICYLRALGETGDLNGLLEVLDRSERILEKISDPVTRNLGLLFAFAFCGQKEQVARLLNGPLAIFPYNVQRFWLATADLAAGNETVAREQLLSIGNGGDIRIHKAVLRYLSQPLVDPEVVLTEKSRLILFRLSNEVEQEARFSFRGDFRLRRANATYVLIGLNLLAFALEVMLGGSENFDTLYRLGALIPVEVLAGAWWRLLASIFLHFGFLHLLMNMLGLYFLGRFVEFSLGVPRYLLCYFTAGVGSMLAVSVLAVMGYSKAEFVVGASGAIMGLVGVTTAIMLRGWQRGSRTALKHLRQILFIIALQMVFDLTTPQISFIGHTAGVIIGFLVGSLLQHN